MLPACSNNYKEQDTVAQPAAAPAFPSGVSTDVGVGHAGIYPADAESCCWLSDDAKFSTRIPASAHKLTFVVFTPKAPPIVNGGENLTVSIDGKRVKDVKLQPGSGSSVVVPLGSRPGGGDWLARIELKLSNSYVPKDAGINGDLRRLSVVLHSVSAN
jgi:hypothetical protein